MIYPALRTAAFATLLALVPATALVAAPKAVEVTGFTFTWPASLKRWPALVRYLDIRKANARAAYAENFPDTLDPDQDTSSYEDLTEWVLNTELPGLVVLKADRYGFSGGAHGYGFTDALMWDTRANVPLRLDGLFTKPAAAKALLTPAWCKALDKERLARRGEPTPRDDIFGACPDLYKDVVAYPGTIVGGKYGRIQIHAGPYVAGSYAEGQYDAAIYIPKGLKALVKPQYRALFPG